MAPLRPPHFKRDAGRIGTGSFVSFVLLGRCRDCLLFSRFCLGLLAPWFHYPFNTYVTVCMPLRPVSRHGRA
jgi:hypothetical protein